MTTMADPRVRQMQGGESAGFRWWVAERLPSRPLCPYLQGYADYLEAEPGPFRRRHEPSGYVTFILNFAEPLEVAMPASGHASRPLRSSPGCTSHGDRPTPPATPAACN